VSHASWTSRHKRLFPGRPSTHPFGELSRASAPSKLVGRGKIEIPSSDHTFAPHNYRADALFPVYRNTLATEVGQPWRTNCFELPIRTARDSGRSCQLR
jgi:hypothetical protein